MKQTDIQTELMRLFDEAGDAGRVVVWHDPDGEFAESVEGLARRILDLALSGVGTERGRAVFLG